MNFVGLTLLFCVVFQLGNVSAVHIMLEGGKDRQHERNIILWLGLVAFSFLTENPLHSTPDVGQQEG